MGFPTVIPMDVLQKTHKEFSAKALKTFNDLYYGGLGFPHKDYLVRRPQDDPTSEEWRARCESAAYTRHSAILDYLVGSLFTVPIEIKSDDEFWKTLSEDADGLHLSLDRTMRRVALDLMIMGRGYLYVSELEDESRLGLTTISPDLVDDWVDHEFIRTHEKVSERKNPWTKPTETEQWSFVTDEGVAVYRRIPQKPDAQRVSQTMHELGELPVVAAELDNWVMDSIAPQLLALYNRENMTEFSITKASTAFLVLNTAKNISEIAIQTPITCIKLDVGESAQMINSNTLIHDAAFKDMEMLRDNIAKALHASALAAAARVQAPRQGAMAAAMQLFPLKALLDSYASPIKDSLKNAVVIIAEASNKPVPEIAGLEDFDVSLQAIIKAIGGGDDGTPQPAARPSAGGQDKPAPEET